METLEVVKDNSMTHESISAVPSSTSYTDHPSIVPSDTASVASNSLHGAATGPMSPARSIRSGPTSPSSVAGSVATIPSGAPRLQQQRSVDLLDNPAASNPFDNAYPTTRDRSGLTSSDDDQTEPSSSATGNTGENPAGYTRSDLNATPTSTFGRLIETTKRRLNTGDKRQSNSEDDDDEDDMVESALIYGYLQKLGRNGKWQTRWFETDGECLTYYKSSKRTKLLATLDLAKVGSIVINHQDRNGTTFTINISERPYHLRADSMAACKDWVITLNRVKEARMREGNVKLSLPSDQPPDLLDSHNFTPRVVVVANRQRTRAIDDDDIQSWENGAAWGNNPANDGRPFMAPSSSGRLARWQKPRNSLSRLASKLARWARSIRKFGCVDAENHVVLDHHLHPPGHDDKKRSGGSSPTGSKQGIPVVLSSDRSANANDDTSAPGDDREEEDDDIRYLS